MKYLRKGMIVKWSGNSPCIGKLIKRERRDCWVLNDTESDENGEYYDSCHKSHLRRATEVEKKQYRKSGLLILKTK